MIINTQEDLNAIAGTPKYEQFIAFLRGSLFSIRKDEITHEWVADENDEMVERFGLTRADFDPIAQPVLPAAVEVDAIRAEIQNANKADCTACILAAYPEPIQRSAALGVYPQATADLISAYIAACVVEENRVFDLLEVATAATLSTIEAPVWPEVTDA